MKTVTAIVRVNFSEDIENETEVLQRIMDALIDQANHEGLAPEAEEAFTTSLNTSLTKTQVKELNHSFI